MKNQFTSRIVKLTFAFMFVLIASSCSQDDEAMDAAVLAKEINSELLAKANTKVSTQSTLKTTTVTVADCSAGCISERVLFEDNTNDEIGKSDKYKNVNYQIWNTATQLIVQTTSNVATDKVLIVVNGVTYTNDPSSDIPADQVMYTYFNLPAGYTACQYTLESVRVDGGGHQAELTGINYGVYEYCSTCTIEGEQFSGAAVTCGTSREANFTFSSEDGVGYFKMQGGLTNFTGGDAVVILYDADDNVISDGYTVTQVIQGGSSNRRITVVGALSECGSIRVNIKWDSTNSGGIITGSWSVKDVDGLEYAPEVAGLECL